MRLRATPLHLLGAVALAALVAANAAFACDGAHAKSARAAAMSCPHACPMTSCRQVTAVAATPAPAPLALVNLPGLPSLVQPAQPIVAGLMAFLDPETGLIGGPIGDLQVPQDLTQLNGQSLLTPVTLPNGSVMIDLQGTMQDYMILTIDPLGHRSFRCSTDPREATKPAAPVTTPALTPTER
jgi:hypothetical protein